MLQPFITAHGPITGSAAPDEYRSSVYHPAQVDGVHKAGRQLAYTPSTHYIDTDHRFHLVLTSRSQQGHRVSDTKHENRNQNGVASLTNILCAAVNGDRSWRHSSSVRVCDMWEEVFPNLQHMLSVRTWCRPTSLSAPLEAASSSLSISWRSWARRSFSARDKSAASLLPHTSCWGGGGGYQEKTEYPKQISVSRSTPAGFTRVSLLNWKMNILLAWKTNRRLKLSHVPWTLTNLDVPVDKVLLSLLVFRGSTVTASKLLFPGLLAVYFKWSAEVAPLFTCQTSISQKGK